MESNYTAQICVNGHCVSDAQELNPLQSENYCHICGAQTINACPVCNAQIRGNLKNLAVTYKVPSYCYNCGTPFPWRSAAIEAAAELIKEDSQIPSDQKNTLISSLPDFIAETPKTQLASVRFKKALAVADEFTAEGLRQFAVDFACGPALKIIGI